MDFLLNPNIAYILIVGAFLLTLIAIIIPGTGIPEILLAFFLVLAIYVVYNLGINALAVLVLVFSIIPFLLAIRARAWRIPLLAATFLLLIGGSVFMFTGENGFPLVDPFLVAIVSLISGGLIWIGAERGAAAMHQAPVHNLDALIGQIAEARTAIHEEGSVQINGELWSARSEKPIKAKSPVRILRREGLILIVEEESQ
jgi:membrane-bound serine protease (ClpP class)